MRWREVSNIVVCPKCGKKLRARDGTASKKAKCPGCGTVLVLPQPVKDAEAFVPGASDHESLSQPPQTPPQNPVVQPSPEAASDNQRNEASWTNLNQEEGDTAGSGVAIGATGTEASDSGQRRRPCSTCGEMVIVGALKCRFCGEVFDATLKKEQESIRRATAADEELGAGGWATAILLPPIGCVVGIVWLIQRKPKAERMILVSLAAIGVFTVCRFLFGLAMLGIEVFLSD